MLTSYLSMKQFIASKGLSVTKLKEISNMKFRPPIPDYIMTLCQLCFLMPKNGQLEYLTPTFYIKSTIARAVVFIPVAMTFIQLWKTRTNDMEVLLYDINIIIVMVTIVLMFACFLYKLRSIITTTLDFREYITISEEHKALEKYMEHFTKSALRIATLFIVSFAGYRITEQEDCKDRLSYDDAKDYCGVIMPYPLTPGSDSFTIKLIISLVQMVSIEVLYISLIAAFSLCVWCLEHVIATAKLLRKSMTELSSGRNYYFYRTHIKYFVKYHMMFVEFAKRIDECGHVAHFVHVTNASLIFMLSLIDIYMNRNFAIILHLTGWFAPLFYLARLGQRIIDECDALSLAVYETKWYEMDVRLRNDIRLILLYTQKPVYMRAGPFAILSHFTFLQIMKGACSYCTVYINLTKKQ